MMGGALLSKYKNFHSSEYLDVNSPLAVCWWTTGISRTSWGAISLAVHTNTGWHSVFVPGLLLHEVSVLAWELHPLLFDILSSSDPMHPKKVSEKIVKLNDGKYKYKMWIRTIILDRDQRFSVKSTLSNCFCKNVDLTGKMVFFVKIISTLILSLYAI